MVRSIFFVFGLSLIASACSARPIEAVPVSEIELCSVTAGELQLAARRWAAEIGATPIGTFENAKDFETYVLVMDLDPVFARNGAVLFPRYYIASSMTSARYDREPAPQVDMSQFENAMRNWFERRFPC